MARVKKDNFNRFQRDFTINVSKQLQKIAQKTELNVSKVVEEKLLSCYKENVFQSYAPRSVGAAQDILFNEKAKQAELEDRKKGLNVRHRRRTISYKHTGNFMDSIYIEKEGNKLKVKIRDIKYPTGESTTDVYKWLTDGTDGGGTYWFTNRTGKRPTAYNYPTPRHEFEEQTMVQMLGYLESLKSDIKNGNYSK